MFGTLTGDLRCKKPLTFVENTDPASALSRNRREKRHTSCESCRARKVRCSGQPSGCDRCVAVMAECLYPSRELRQRKRAASSRQADDTSTMRGTSVDINNAGVEGEKEGESQGQNRSQGPPLSADDTETLGPELGPGKRVQEQRNQQQQEQLRMEHCMSAFSVGRSTPSTNVGDTFDEWPDVDGFLDPMLMAEPGNLNSNMILDDGMINYLSEGTNDFNNGFDDISPSGFSGVGSLGQHTTPSPADIVRPETSLATPSTGSHQNKKLVRRGSTSPDHAKDGCRCLRLTARLLEELGAKSASSSRAPLDVLLGYFRRALVDCATILHCEQCSSLGENNMLLAMSGQYMSLICERIALAYLEQSQHQRSISSSSGTWPTTPVSEDVGDGDCPPPTGADDMWFSTYRIENSSERMQVFRSLATVQLTEFSRLLEKLKVRAGSGRGQQVLLTETEKRIKAALQMLQANLDPLSVG